MILLADASILIDLDFYGYCRWGVAAESSRTENYRGILAGYLFRLNKFRE